MNFDIINSYSYNQIELIFEKTITLKINLLQKKIYNFYIKFDI